MSQQELRELLKLYILELHGQGTVISSIQLILACISAATRLKIPRSGSAWDPEMTFSAKLSELHGAPAVGCISFKSRFWMVLDSCKPLEYQICTSGYQWLRADAKAHMSGTTKANEMRTVAGPLGFRPTTRINDE